MNSHKEDKKSTELFDRLLKNGLIIHEVKINLLLSFNNYVNNDFIKKMAENEILLLEEISKIDEKLKRKQDLTSLETRFWEFFLKEYKISS